MTAGPTYETLDRVRRLTNFSTGRLGTLLAEHLTAVGHEVVLLRSELAVYRSPGSAVEVVAFGSTDDLAARLLEFQTARPLALFHAAAVSDFTFGQVWGQPDGNDLRPVSGSKLSSRNGRLMVELRPAPKLLPQLRFWYPQAFIVGWKYETEGDRARISGLGVSQLELAQTDACVVNGPGYGRGYGLIRPKAEVQDLPGDTELFGALAGLLEEARAAD